MSTEGLINRKELAAAVGMKLGTFWRKLLEYNRDRRRQGLDGLSPDKIAKNARNRPQHLFKPERAPLFKAAVESMPTNQRGRPTKPQPQP